MTARSQGKLYAQRRLQSERDVVHRWVFVHSLTPEVEYAVYTPHLRPTVQARTHIVLNDTPPLPSLARNDEAVEVNACGLNARDAAKALIKATGLNPHLSVCGRPFCLDDMERGAI